MSHIILGPSQQERLRPCSSSPCASLARRELGRSDVRQRSVLGSRVGYGLSRVHKVSLFKVLVADRLLDSFLVGFGRFYAGLGSSGVKVEGFRGLGSRTFNV